MPNYPYTFQLPPLNVQDIPNDGVAGEFLGINGSGVLDWLPVSAGAGDMLKADNLSGLTNYTTARTNIGLGTTDSPTFANLTLTSPSLSSSAPVTISQTWNNAAVAFTGLKFNAAGTSDANSASGSLLADFQVGGVSKFTVRKDGAIVLPYGYAGIVDGSVNAGGTNYTWGGPRFGPFAFISWTATSPAGTADTILLRDGAGQLALRNGAAAQTFNVYGTYTSITDYKRLSLSCSATTGNATIGVPFNSVLAVTGGSSPSTTATITFATQAAAFPVGSSVVVAGVTPSGYNGTYIVTASTTSSVSYTVGGALAAWSSGGTATVSGAASWILQSGGHLLTGVDNQYDIGANGASRPRDIHAGGNGIFGGLVSALNGFRAPSSSQLIASANGIWRLTNSSADDFNRLQFGGTTNLFPAIKRNAAGLQIRLADDSANATLEAGNLYASGNVGIGTTAPVTKLHVGVNNNGLNIVTVFYNENNTPTGGNAVGFAFMNEGGNAVHYKASIVHERTATWARGKLHFLLNNVEGGAATSLADARMTIQPDGNVGIGTTSPSSKLHVAGEAFLAVNGSNTAPSLRIGAGANINGWYSFGGLQLNAVVNSLNMFGITSSGTNIGAGNLSFGSGDAVFERDGEADHLAMRRGALGQKFSVYGTYPGAAWERFTITAPTSGNVLLGTYKGTGGIARGLELQTDGVTRITLGATGTTTLEGNNNSISGFRFFGLGSNSLLIDNGSGNFNRFCLGGTSASYPALKRVGSEFQIVKADTTAADNVASADADLTFIEDRYRRKGSGTPEGVVTAPIGAVYHNTTGGAGTSFYVKESGTGNTGWVGK